MGVMSDVWAAYRWGPIPSPPPGLKVQSENVRGNADGAYATSCAPPEHVTHGNHDPWKSA